MAKKSKPTKSLETRTSEVSKFFTKLAELGFSTEHVGIQEFRKIALQFQEQGWSSSGSIKLTGHQRILVYIFSQQPHIDSKITLEYHPHV